MQQTTGKIPVGISSCLLGEAVRFDGGHKYHAYINRRLADYFEFRPFCPEVAIGLGTPREPIHLVKTVNGVRVLAVADPFVDVTQELSAYGMKIAQEFDGIYGYIFKARSPSCGMKHVQVWDQSGVVYSPDGIGAFARAIMQAHPDLPVEEECRLSNSTQCEIFIERVTAWYCMLHS